MRNKRVVIYGGTELDKRLAEFVSDLAYKLLQNERIVLATGGFKSKKGQRRGTSSTDMATLRGAERFEDHHKESLESCLETWVPERSKDRLDEGVARFPDGRQEVLDGLSAQARRLRLVQIADAIITVCGEVRTALVLEMALAIARPALPLPFTEGDSRTHWAENRPYYLTRFGISEGRARQWEKFRIAKANTKSKVFLISQIADAISRVIRRTCLVLMPFREELDRYYYELEKVIDSEGFHAIRLDQDLYAGDIRETVRRLLRKSDAIVADVTDVSPNVMYEIGLAHANGREPLLLWRGSSRSLKKLVPFYLRPQRIALGTNQELHEALRQYLEATKEGM